MFLEDGRVRILMTSKFGAMNFTAHISAFGKNTLPKMYNVSVRLLPTVPADGCSNIKEPQAKYHKDYAAFIQRGVCAFEEKIMRAQKSGASMVFIADHDFQAPVGMGRMKTVCIPFHLSYIHDES